MSITVIPPSVGGSTSYGTVLLHEHQQWPKDDGRNLHQHQPQPKDNAVNMPQPQHNSGNTDLPPPHRTARPKVSLDVATSCTQTTEFLEYFREVQSGMHKRTHTSPETSHTLELMKRQVSSVRAHLATDYHDELQLRVLAERQVVQNFLREQRSARPRSARQHADHALSAGFSSTLKYDGSALESLTAVCNSYEAQVLELQMTLARMGERCDKVAAFELANRQQAARHAAEMSSAEEFHAARVAELEASHAAECAQLKEAHAATVKGLHEAARAQEQAGEVEMARVVALHESELDTHKVELALRQARIGTVEEMLMMARREGADEARHKRHAEAKLTLAERQLGTLIKACFRLNQLVVINAKAAKVARAANAIQSAWAALRLRVARREQERNRAARIIQVARHRAVAKRAARADADARQLKQSVSSLQAKVDTMAMLNAQLGRASAVAAELDTARLEEQEKRMKEAAEETERAKEANARAVAKDSRIQLIDADTDEEIALRDGLLKVFRTDFVLEHVRHHVRASQAGTNAASELKAVGKFANEVDTLIMGDPEQSALGLMAVLKVDMFDLFGLLANGVEAIVSEMATNGTDVDKECLNYVLYERAGSSKTSFKNSPYPRDCDENGVRVDRLTASGEGMLLSDFCNHPSALTAALSPPHVVAIRLYSTAAFMSLNNPLRDRERTTAHPFAATIFFLADGIKKLRTVEADREKKRSAQLAARTALKAGGQGRRGGIRQPNQSIDLWRGMRNLKSATAFLEHGGAEVALMSTTSELEVAVGYALSPHSILFKIKTASFMQRGADIKFLSAFPAEAEFLYPPLTYLRPTGRCETLNITPHAWGGGGTSVKFTVIEVEPQLA